MRRKGKGRVVAWMAGNANKAVLIVAVTDGPQAIRDREIDVEIPWDVLTAVMRSHGTRGRGHE